MRNTMMAMGAVFAFLFGVVINGEAQEVGVHIKEYGNSGKLSFAPVTNAAYYRVEWSSSAQGPWSGSWEAFHCIVPTNNADVVLHVPHFYRVTAVLKGYLDRPQVIDPVPNVDADKLQLVPRGSNTCHAMTQVNLEPIISDVPFTLDYDLWMGQYEVTYAFYSYVYTSQTSRAYSMNPGYRGGAYPLNPSVTADDHPVTCVNWYDALKFCNKLSELAGLAPVYYCGTEVFTSGEPKADSIVTFDLADGFRLPTQVEWEYCARGGLQGKLYPWGDALDRTYANCFYNVGHTTPAGAYPKGIAGGIGGLWDLADVELYDMGGNVYEHLWDRTGDAVVYRCGLSASCHFNTSSYALKCSERMFTGETYKEVYVGFRVCRSSR